MNKLLQYIFIFLILPLLFPPSALAADTPFTNPNNWGATGLMETPTARVLEHGKFRIGVSQVDPYRYYYGAVSPLKGLEIDGRITEALGIKASPEDPKWAGYGNNKDKAIDLKYQFIPEGKYWPAMAIGIMDPHGTRKYGGQYLVISKQIFPFDFTIGLGNGRFGKKPLAGTDGERITVEMFEDPRQWWNDAQFFGGVEFHPTPKLSFMVEYNPIKYEIQTGDMVQAKYFTQAVPSKINVGMRYKPFDWTEIDLSYQRGNQIGFSLSLAFNLDKPLMPLFDLPYKEKEEYKVNPLAERISRGLNVSGFTDIGIKISAQEIWIQAANTRYLYNMRAIGVILKVLDQILPADIRRINLVLTDRGIPLIEFCTDRNDLRDFEKEMFKVHEYGALSEIKTDIYQMPDTSRQYKRYFDYGIKPEFQTFLNDPSGFFKGRAGVSGWIGLQPWKGGDLSIGAEAYAWNNISSANEPLPNAVRSDSVVYMQKNMALRSLMFEQIGKTKYEIYGKAAIGLLENQYAGLDTEIAMPLFRGRILAGVSGSLVKKRDPDNLFKLNNNDFGDHYSTAFVNTRLNLPELEMALDVKAGRFLAGDKGARVTISRSFYNGVVLSGWYGYTDTSVFTDSFNKGYRDKGIAISIPLRLFLGRDSRTLYHYALSPWTRDVAQDITHRTSLFDFIGRNTRRFIDKDSHMLK